jgi:chaperonin GroES
MKLTPLGDRVVVKPIEGVSKTKSGLYIPDTAKEKSHQGKVLAVGPGKTEEGKLIEMSVKVGDIVLYKEYGGDDFKLDNEPVVILEEKDILGVINE